MRNSFEILNGCATGLRGNPVKNSLVRILTSSSEYTSDNAWNVNGQSAQANNNNKYNANGVRPVVALDRERVNGWMTAYAECLKNKTTSKEATRYRINDEDILKLMIECEERRYEPAKSICFCVSSPKVREIFAANFRDRIVQHWICLRIEPLLEARFIEQGNVSWNCRKGRGTHRAVEALRQDILYVSDNYKEESWVGRFDVVSFFMSIDIGIMEKIAIELVEREYKNKDKGLLIYLLKTTIRHRPQDNSEKRGDIRLWKQMSKGKSLFDVERCRGMPIGNITSQLLANLYMSYLDEHMIELCKKKDARYERFVDDFAIVTHTKTDLIELRNAAEKYLNEKLHLKMHHDKQYIQEVKKGVKFVGSVIKMKRLYVSNRTVGALTEKLKELNDVLKTIEQKGQYEVRDAWELERYESSLNSYLGMTKNRQSYNIKRGTFEKYGGKLWNYYTVMGRFEKVKLRKEYKVTYQLLIKENYEECN